MLGEADDSAHSGTGRALRLAPKLSIGRTMPCHAFTDRLLLLARGERIVSHTQIERLSRADVVFSEHPPLWLVPLIEERERALGIRPQAAHRPPRLGTAQDAEPEAPDSPDEPSEDTVEFCAAPAPFLVEVAAARRLRHEAMRQVGELVEQARSGRTVDLQPVRGTVRRVVASVRRNERAFTSLLRLKTLDTYTYTHSINSCVLSIILAQHSDRADQAEIIGLGALAHDIGKVLLPEDVLRKPGHLTADEWSMVKQHPSVGLEIVRLSPETQEPAIEAIGQHHERLDGSGYPAGLRDMEIAPPGRIVAVADVYDAMTSARPYHQPIAPHDAMRWIFQHGGDLFDPHLVRAFVQAVGLFPVGTLVRLTAGELAVVIGINPLALQRPTVLIVPDLSRGPHAEPWSLDLGQDSVAATAREILRVEDPADFGIDIDGYLEMAPDVARIGCRDLDLLA